MSANTIFPLMPLRLELQKFFTKPSIEYLTIGIILINSIVLGIETYADLNHEVRAFLYFLDHACLGFFVIEIGLKIFAFGRQYFHNYWHVFDIVVVGIALIPFDEIYSVIRAFRILRLLMAVEPIPGLRILIEALFSSFTGVISILSLILLVMFIFGVIGVELFGHDFPDHFGNLGRAMFCEIQILTFDNWFQGIAKPITQRFSHAWIYFVSLIIIVGMGILNLFVSLLVNAIDEQRENEMSGLKTKAHKKKTKALGTSLRAVKKDIEELEVYIDNLTKKTIAKVE